MDSVSASCKTLLTAVWTRTQLRSRRDRLSPRRRGMSHFPDLSFYTYGWSDGLALNVGWLDARHSHTRGETSSKFRRRLKALCRNTPILGMHMGPHTCEF